MDIRQIMTVLAVAKFKSFSEAAEKISFSQSTVSKHINTIEEELGVKIFERKQTAQSAIPTEAGEKVLKGLDKIVADYNDLCIMAKNTASNESHPVSLGSTPSMGSYGEDILIADYADSYPNSKIFNVIGGSFWLTEMLKSARIDAAVFAIADALWPQKNFLEYVYRYNCIAIPLVPCLVTVGLSLNHPLAGEKSLKLIDLKDELFILKNQALNPEECFSPHKNDYFIELCKEAGFDPKIRSVDDYSGKIRPRMAAKGSGIMLSTCVVQHYQNLRFIPIEPQPFSITGYMIALKGNKTPNLKNLVNTAVKISESNGFKTTDIINR